MKSKETILALAEVVDAWRVFPRIFVFAYGWYAWRTGEWFMGLEKASMEQAGFAGAIVGLCAPILNWYMQTGRKWADERKDQ